MYVYFTDENFITDQEGNEVYIDALKSANFSKWNIAKIVEYMKKGPYSPEDISAVKKSFSRLQLLPDTYEKDMKAREDYLKNMR